MNDGLIVNIEFNNMFAKKASMLYLYYRLRDYSSTRGGSIVGFKFTRSDRYGNFKELKKLGWVTEDRFVNYRNTVLKYVSISVSTRVTKNDLASLNNFKGFLIASTESYILNRNNKIQIGRARKRVAGDYIERNWDNAGATSNEKFWLKTKKIVFDGKPSIIGRVYAGLISKIMGISLRTITRWRLCSPNSYRTIWHRPEKTPYSGRDISMYFKAGDNLFTVDQKIISYIPVFNYAPASIISQKM